MLSVTSKLLVAAIDLGTDGSGYGYSFRSDYEKDPMKVYTRTWNSGCLRSSKQPTCVLCDPAGHFDSFGHEAEDKYCRLSEDKEHYNWYFLRNFINMLSEKQVNMEFELTDEKGLKMPAIQVFSMAIRYLKDDLLDNFKSHLDLRENEFHWVLPVPATWSVSAKEFFREAAIKIILFSTGTRSDTFRNNNEGVLFWQEKRAKMAGINGENLTIALEHDAAAVYCEALTSMGLSCGGLLDDKYMVIDLGDSTAVFTVHKRQPNGTIQLVNKVSSVPWGSTKVIEEFTQMIISIVGDQTFKKFRYDNPEYLADMLRGVEAKTNNICIKDNHTIVINVPIALGKTYKNITGKTVQDAIEQSPYKEKIHWNAEKMRIDAELFRSLFQNCISSITNHIENLCQEPSLKGISTFLMIGKFSGCRLVQEAVIKAFPKTKVLIPNEQLAVLKGAVVLGHKFGLTCWYNQELQQPMNKEHSTVATTLAKQDENDVASDDYASESTSSNLYPHDFRNDPIANLKSKSEVGEDALSSDCLKMRVQTNDKGIQFPETQLKNQMTLEAGTTKAPSDDELFALSKQLNKHENEWWFLAKLLGLSDKQIHEIECGAGSKHIVRQYYTMLTAWRGQNAGQEKGSIRYLLKQCDEAGIDQNVTDTVFGN